MCEDQPHTCHLSVAHFLVSKIWYQLIDKIVNGSLIAAVAIALLFCEMQKKVKPAGNRRCLVLSDGYVSEYAWGPYSEAGYPPSHPGHEWGSAASIVSNDSQSDTPVRGDLTEGSTDMTGRTDRQLGDRAWGSAISSAGLHSRWFRERRDRRFGPQSTCFCDPIKLEGCESSGRALYRHTSGLTA